MWKHWKRCPFLCSIFILFFLLFIIGINTGDGFTKEETLAYISSPVWERTFNPTLTEFSETEDIILNAKELETDNPISVSPTPTPREQTTEVPKVPTPSSICTSEPTKKGVTKFKKYTPKKIDSPFYSDVGMTALTTVYEYQKVGDFYFKDAASIGDSRMLGMYDYTALKEQADFFCESGFSLYRWTQGEKITWKNQNKKVDLESVMKNNSYKKIYYDRYE